jgi:hypothetical protein
MQVVTACAPGRLSDVAALIVHSDAKSEAAPDQKQVPPGATANVNHSLPLRDDVVKPGEFGPQNGLDLGRLRGRIQSPVQ